jgi:site-specific DNA-cytosine methylase
MKVGSLFAGIGGFDLGFERAGFEVTWCVEWDKNAQAVLRKRFPNAQVGNAVTVNVAEWIARRTMAWLT